MTLKILLLVCVASRTDLTICNTLIQFNLQEHCEVDDFVEDVVGDGVGIFFFCDVF